MECNVARWYCDSRISLHASILCMPEMVENAGFLAQHNNWTWKLDLLCDDPLPLSLPHISHLSPIVSLHTILTFQIFASFEWGHLNPDGTTLTQFQDTAKHTSFVLFIF